MMQKTARSLIAALLLLVFVTACSKVSSRDVRDFAERANLAIPDSAAATAYKQYLSDDGMIFLRLEIPAADLEAFLRDSGLGGVLTNTKDPGPALASFGGVLAEHPSKFREGQKDLGGGYFLNVLIDEDSPTNVAYLLWFGS
jgi:hypothetical protein